MSRTEKLRCFVQASNAVIAIEARLTADEEGGLDFAFERSQRVAQAFAEKLGYRWESEELADLVCDALEELLENLDEGS